ncbi:MAG: RNA-binding domain-containing protein [Promethearchaeota archaeon]
MGGEIIQITIKTPINPTEDWNKVSKCLENIIHNPIIKKEEMHLIVRNSRIDLLSLIREKLKTQRIRDSARKILFKSIDLDSLTFHLNKQAAFIGRIHFVTNPEREDFLGPITITIEATEKEIKEIINWLTMVDFEVD